jgi:hypothetical protein
MKQIGRIRDCHGKLGGSATNSNTAPVPGKTTLVEQLPAAPAQAAPGRPPVQASGELTGADPHRWAAHGTRGATGPLPHADRIQALFGHHDIRGVRAAVGGPAADASSAQGARAYASGDAVAFAEPPDLQLAAHEAAHVVQQRGGVRLADGLGRPGDRYEQHADAVADAIVRGESAEPLLDTMAHRGATGGAAVQGQAIQRADAPAPAPATPAAAGPASGVRTVSGQGGYTYEQRADGSITVITGPHSVGQSYPLGHPVNQAITAEIGPFSAAAAPAERPAAPAAPAPGAPAGAAPAAATPATAPAPSSAPSQAPSLLARAESSLGDFVGWVGSFFTGGEEAPADGAAGDAPVFGQEPDTCEDPGPGELEELMKQDRLTPEQIARARELIAQLPPEQQKPMFLQLQDKSEYLNQRDNKSAQETDDGGTCNLTSVAMVLEYLGVSNPDPTRQFEDVLVEKAGKSNIKSPDTWKAVAAQFGVQMEFVVPATTDEGTTIERARWEAMRDQHLAAGQGIAMSLRGHIVRLQGMNEDGLIVDDPYGASTLAADKRITRNGETERYNWEKDGVNTKDGGAGSSKGEDHGYPWADVVTYRFKYVVAFTR